MPTTPSPTLMDVKSITDDSRRLFTPDRKQFYRPLDGLDGYFQNFNAAGEATGFYWNKADNQIFKFDDPTKTGFDQTTKKPIFSANSQIFKVKQENGVWRGDQVMANGNPTGVFYNYGMPRSGNNSVANSNLNYEFKFGLDKSVANTYYNPAQLDRQLFDLGGEEKVLYFDQNPFQVSDFKNLKTYNQSQMSNYWLPPPVQRPFSPVFSQGRQGSTFQQPVNGQIPSSGTGYILVSDPLNCGPCRILESKLTPNTRSKISQVVTSHTNVTGIPTLVTNSGHFVGPDNIINFLKNN